MDSTDYLARSFLATGRSRPSFLLAYRIVGCIGWLSGDDWDEWNADPNLPEVARTRLQRWRHRLLEWAKATPVLSTALA